MRYSQGYKDALFDVMQWFEGASQDTLVFPKKTARMLMVILRRIYQDRNLFAVQKLDYEFTYTVFEKEEIKGGEKKEKNQKKRIKK
ncbi:MAG: hypothetical protein FWH12_03765 [Treponema sp.]|nr:hypothetical protein [Treponema sp.]